MRVIEDKKPEKKQLEEGKKYSGLIEDYEITSFNRKDGGKGYGLKLKIKPSDQAYYTTTAFDFIGHDEDGPYVYKDSSMETWLKRIFGVDSLAKVVIAEVKGKSCQFSVKVENRTWNDKKTGEKKTRAFADVTEIFASEGALASNGASHTAASSTAPASKPKSTGNDDWGDGESL